MRGLAATSTDALVVQFFDDQCFPAATLTLRTLFVAWHCRVYANRQHLGKFVLSLRGVQVARCAGFGANGMYRCTESGDSKQSARSLLALQLDSPDASNSPNKEGATAHALWYSLQVRTLYTESSCSLAHTPQHACGERFARGLAHPDSVYRQCGHESLHSR